MNQSFERDLWIDAPRDRVWQAITDPDQLAQWLLPPAMGMPMKRGEDGTMYVCMGPMEIPVAEFMVTEPPRQVVMRGLPDRLLSAMCVLDEESNGTRVTVSMHGFELLSEDARQDRMGPMNTGWEKALENLKAHITGTELPYPQGYVAALFGYRREGAKTFAIERSIWIKAPIQRVWRAITDPEQIQRWFSPSQPWRLSAFQVGGRLAVYDPATNADTHVEVIEVIEPPHRFATRSVAEPPATSQVTTYTLKEENGGTRLTLTNSGYELLDGDARHQNIEQNAFGFGMMLENLQAYLEDRDLPYPMGF